MEQKYNYYSPSMLSVDGTLVTVSCRAKAGAQWGFIQLLCERQRTDGTGQTSTVICSPPARVINSEPDNTKTAFFTAPATALTKDGSIILLSAFFPESKGCADKHLLEKKKIACAYHDGKRYPLIYDRDGNFFYILDDGSVIDRHKQPTAYTVEPLGELYKNGEYVGNIYLNGAKGKPDRENQTTHGAPLKAPKRSYLLMFRSSDGGKTWSAPKDITPFILSDKDSPYLVTASGAALTTDSGRLIFTLKSEKENICIYTDDGGETWCRNQRQPFTGTKGDWIAYETPDRHLHAVANNGGKLSAGLSGDNGILWMKGDKPRLKAGSGAFGCLVTEDKVLISHPAPKSAAAGITVGDFVFDKKGGYKSTAWRREEALLEQPIGASTLAKLDEETVAIAYEDTAAGDIKIEFIKLK
ncbi:MAG: exo-alpha-sialidase [Eubacterium sp.]|nr:exo-alpha-sialidase [Eubacterium sp.]